jgi:hypothetical protein
MPDERIDTNMAILEYNSRFLSVLHQILFYRMEIYTIELVVSQHIVLQMH